MQNDSFCSRVFSAPCESHKLRGMNDIGLLQRFETRLAAQRELAPFILRVALGAVFLAHAYAKLVLFTLPGTAQFFEAHGFPGWTAYPVFLLELSGGAALLLGLKVRVVATLLFPVMLGALVPHVENGWMFTNEGGGWEFVAFLLAALVSQALLGPGAFALHASPHTPGTPAAHAGFTTPDRAPPLRRP